MQHFVGVKVVFAGPIQPEALDAAPRIHQDAIQIKQDSVAVVLK
jgi:hypothetical protein